MSVGVADEVNNVLVKVEDFELALKWDLSLSSPFPTVARQNSWNVHIL
jgi:hypothetical protein